jgi:Predicted transcriptional regulators
MFSIRLKELRDDKMISQKDFAKIIGVAQSTYALYETRKREPALDVLIKIAQYFNVTTDYLLGLSEGATIENEFIYQDTALNNESIFFLKQLKDRPEYSKIFNDLINTDLFFTLLDGIYNYSESINDLHSLTIADVLFTNEKKVGELKKQIEEEMSAPVVILNIQKAVYYHKNIVSEIFNNLLSETYPIENHLTEKPLILSESQEGDGNAET